MSYTCEDRPLFHSIPSLFMKSLLLLAGLSGLALNTLVAQKVPVADEPDIEIIGSLSDGSQSASSIAKPARQFNVRYADDRELATGAKLKLRWVDPPVRPLPPPEPPSPAEAKQWTDEEVAEMLKDYVPERWITPSVTVIDRKATLLRWRHEGEPYAAYSNIDFNHMTGFGSFRIGEQRYSLFMWTVNARAEWFDKESDPWVDDALAMPSDPPQFEVIQGDSSNEKALSDILALHKLYAKEGPRLVEAHRKREAARKEREEYLKAFPPGPKDVEVRIWANENSNLMKTPPDIEGMLERRRAQVEQARLLEAQQDTQPER